MCFVYNSLFLLLLFLSFVMAMYEVNLIFKVKLYSNSTRRSKSKIETFNSIKFNCVIFTHSLFLFKLNFHKRCFTVVIGNS